MSVSPGEIGRTGHGLPIRLRTYGDVEYPGQVFVPVSLPVGARAMTHRSPQFASVAETVQRHEGYGL